METIKIKKFDSMVNIGVGILTKNPDIVSKSELQCYDKRIWVQYEGYWYLTKLHYCLLEHIDFAIAIKDKTYCREQLLERVMAVICINNR